MFWSISCVCVLVLPIHTKNYTKAYIKKYLVCTTVSLSHFRELDNIDGSMKLLHLKHFV